MGQARRASKQQAAAQRQSRQHRRLAWFVAVPGVLAMIVAAVVLTSQPGYSSFEVIGTQPTVVFVFLPG
jgi:hypothetical protein